MVELTILMPSLNEAETLEACIAKASSFLERYHVNGEILIADNGSIDGSQKIAARCGARVVHVQARGYGATLIEGISAARGIFVIMGDSDDSYDFERLDPFLDKLRSGYDLVMGNRFKGGIRPKAMPPLHRYLGNPVLTTIGRVLFASPCGDFHCGLRGFRRDHILSLGLECPGMEFASEMVVKATLKGLRIGEVPTTLSPDGRSRSPHLKSWRDGWRHLRFLLLFSPRWLFFYPGASAFILGLIGMVVLSSRPLVIHSVTFDVHTLLFASVATTVGFQSVLFFTFSKIFAISEGLLPPDPLLERLLSIVTLEVGLIIGGVLVIAGLTGFGYAVASWGAQDFGQMVPSHLLRIVVPSGTATVVGFDVICGSFFISVLEIRAKKRRESIAAHHLNDAA